MEIKPFLPVVKNKNKSNVENCKKKKLQNSLYVIAIYLQWMCK